MHTKLVHSFAVPPSWTHEPNDLYSAVEGSSVVFDCQAAGQPVPQVLWKHLPITVSTTATSHHSQDDLSTVHTDRPTATPVDVNQYQLIRSGPHYQVFENGSLRISEVRSVNDHGQFLCQATNGVGPVLSKVVSLKVNGTITHNYLNLIEFEYL